jgi:OmpA-OmpF porin, OOP family
MKTKLFAAVLVAAAFAPVAAQAQTYIGGSVGRSEQKLEAGGASVKDSDTGYKLFAGYQFNETFGIEGGFADLGKTGVSGGGNSANANPQTVYFAGTAAWALSTDFSLFAKAGVSANRTKVDGTDGKVTFNDTMSKTTAILGVGAAYSLSKNVALTLEYENFGKVIDDSGVSLKADLISFGVRYKF